MLNSPDRALNSLFIGIGALGAAMTYLAAGIAIHLAILGPVFDWHSILTIAIVFGWLGVFMAIFGLAIAAALTAAIIVRLIMGPS